ncbi:MAG TPA: hypothetical protein VFH29_05775, partial [Anaerolineales bacterium]|nr:hypothetical protein [Anaerolineales bacterium]
MHTANRVSSFVRTYFAVGAAISLLAIIQTQAQTQALFKLRTRYKWALLMALFAFHMAAGIYVAIRGRGVPMRVRPPALLPIRTALRVIGGLILFLLPVAAFLIARQDFFGRG